jgi:5-methylcytosine-specific restriction endonuclease McrA
MPCLRCGRPNGGRGYCEEHAHLNRGTGKAKPKVSRHVRGYDYAWTKVRALVLATSRECHWCGGHADTVDHLIPISIDPSLRLDLSNLVPACRSCNSGRKGGRGVGS